MDSLAFAQDDGVFFERTPFGTTAFLIRVEKGHFPHWMVSSSAPFSLAGSRL